MEMGIKSLALFMTGLLLFSVFATYVQHTSGMLTDLRVPVNERSREPSIVSRAALDTAEQRSSDGFVHNTLLRSSSDGLQRLEADYLSGKISVDLYMLYKTWAVFDPTRLSNTEYALSQEEVQAYRKSGTMLLLEIKEQWNKLSSETQNQLDFVLERPTDVEGGVDEKQHLLPQLYNTTNFVIHWTNGSDGGNVADAVPPSDANTNGVPDYVENFGEIFEYVRNFEVVIRGFHQPPDDSSEPNDLNGRNPDGRYDVFVYNMSFYGYAMPESGIDSLSYYSYIGVDNDYVGFPTPQLPSMQVTAAHEFFHAIQFYYDTLEESWWMETTATYMEDEVYPDVNDNYQYLPYWFQRSDVLGLESTQDSHAYGNFIFAKRLSEDFGDVVIRDIWEEMETTDGLTAIDNVLVGKGSSLLIEFGRFTIANFFLENMYVDGADYRATLTGTTTFDGVWLEYQYNASALPFGYVVIDQGNVNYDAWMDRWATDYITLKLDPTIEDYRIFFDGFDLTTNYLVILATKKSGVIANKTFSLDAQKDGYVDLSYDAFENVTLIIANAGNTDTANPSWRVIIEPRYLPDILIVDDNDGRPWAYGTSLPEFESALTVAGYDYAVWSESSMGNPPLDCLIKSKLVIWTCGDYYDWAVDQTDAATLESYLSQGGNILLEGEDVAYNHETDNFMTNVAHAIFQVDYTEALGLTVTAPTHPVTQDLPTSFTWLSDPSYDDGVVPTNGGFEVIRYTDTSLTAVTVFDGTGTGNGSVVYYAFPIFCLNQSERDTLIINSVDWLVPPNIAISGITLPKTVVGQGCSLITNVTIINQGWSTETFNVTAYADLNATVIGDEVTIGIQNVTLTSGNSTTILFTWNTTGIPHGNYTISAYAHPVPRERDTANNTFVDDTVFVTIIGDVDGDGTVDASDLSDVSKAYACDSLKPNWNPNCDFNGDGKIDASDLFELSKNYGKTM